MASKASKLFRSYFFDGLLLIALGIVMLVWPEGSLKTLCVIIGAIVAAMGLIKESRFSQTRTGTAE